MSTNKKVFERNYDAGVARVLQGNYAFLMESTMLDYMVQRNCNLTQVGGLLDSKGYGVATPMGMLSLDAYFARLIYCREMSRWLSRRARREKKCDVTSARGELFLSHLARLTASRRAMGMNGAGLRFLIALLFSFLL